MERERCWFTTAHWFENINVVQDRTVSHGGSWSALTACMEQNIDATHTAAIRMIPISSLLGAGSCCQRGFSIPSRCKSHNGAVDPAASAAPTILRASSFCCCACLAFKDLFLLHRSWCEVTHSLCLFCFVLRWLFVA